MGVEPLIRKGSPPLSLLKSCLMIAATVICTAVLLAGGHAKACEGDHRSQKASAAQEGTVSSAVVYNRDINLFSGRIHTQCGAQLCCGSPCHSGGYVLAHDVAVPEPAGSNPMVADKNSLRSAGLGPSGLRRPPRI